MKIRNLIQSCLALALLALFTLNPQLSTCFAQGSLTPPPGVPAPTMLTLNQIEPRTPVDAIHTPGDPGDLYIISQPGSYYLTTNIVGVSVKNGIEITANNVTLDLNGFSLQGVSSADDGIYINGGYINVTVRNGNISGWGGTPHYGIECYATNVILERLNVSANNRFGVLLNSSAVVRNCNVQNNGSSGIWMSSGTVSDCNVLNNGQNGIHVTAGTVSGCTANNNGTIGIYLGAGTVSGCTANNNTGDFGIIVDSGTVSGCTANNNGNGGINLGGGTVSGCTADNNNFVGIYLNPGTASGCFVSSNFNSGIYVNAAGSDVIGNTCIGNNTSDSSSHGGIFIAASNNRVEDNHVTSSGNTGIAVASIPAGYTNNVIIKNTVSGDGANNYSAPAGNDLGPVGAAATSTSPWANISH